MSNSSRQGINNEFGDRCSSHFCPACGSGNSKLKRDDCNQRLCSTERSSRATQIISRRLGEVYDMLLRISETAVFKSDRPRVLKQVKLICHRCETAFCNPHPFSGEVALLFPELFLANCNNARSSSAKVQAQVSSLKWARDSLLSLCLKLEGESRSMRAQTASPRRASSKVNSRKVPLVGNQYYMPWYELIG